MSFAIRERRFGFQGACGTQQLFHAMIRGPQEKPSGRDGCTPSRPVQREIAV